MACVTTARFSILINGELVDFFSSNRGLRQGDPLSPFLFTLVMEVLSRRLKKLESNYMFRFHPKCKRVSLTHLMFADDLLIFSKASESSISAILSALNDFANWSGLRINGDKSHIFFGGVSQETQRALAMSVEMNIGQLPLVYLGIPLDSKVPRSVSFVPIIDKMMGKIRAWSSRNLSYAGRLTLLNHVLSSTCVFWMRSLVFPNGVLRRITSICRNFLWTGKCFGRRYLVGWKEVCLRKDQGGLGVKDLHSLNKALVLSQIWDICLDKECLWIKWMQSYYLRDNSFWNVEEKMHYSWHLKSLLRLRNEALKCLEIDALGNCRWKDQSTPFSTKSTYGLLRNNLPVEPWTKIIWNGFSPPKHSFCCWLAFKNRLPTRDRLKIHLDSPLCCWCNEENETIDHLMFGCLIMQLISPCLLALGFSLHCSNLGDLISWANHNAWRNKEERMAVFFTINAAVYETWRNRNAKIFNKRTWSKDELMKKILKSLKYKCVIVKGKCNWNQILLRLAIIDV